MVCSRRNTKVDKFFNLCVYTYRDKWLYHDDKQRSSILKFKTNVQKELKRHDLYVMKI